MYKILDTLFNFNSNKKIDFEKEYDKTFDMISPQEIFMSTWTHD